MLPIFRITINFNWYFDQQSISIDFSVNNRFWIDSNLFFDYKLVSTDFSTKNCARFFSTHNWFWHIFRPKIYFYWYFDHKASLTVFFDQQLISMDFSTYYRFLLIFRLQPDFEIFLDSLTNFEWFFVQKSISSDFSTKFLLTVTNFSFMNRIRVIFRPLLNFKSWYDRQLILTFFFANNRL